MFTRTEIATLQGKRTARYAVKRIATTVIATAAVITLVNVSATLVEKAIDSH